MSGLAKPKKSALVRSGQDLVIDVNGLTKRYGSLVAVDGLTMKVESGTVYGLVGPNGAGKTTTFSMLLGYTYPNLGGGTVLGTELSRPGDRKGRIGALPQDAALPEHAVVGSLLAYYGRLSGMKSEAAYSEARRVLEIFGLGDRVGSKVRTLSHGMRKRVSMAQAYIGDPELVMLDEPTSGLDPRLAHQVRQYIRDNAKGRTVIISSHNLTEIEDICDHVAILGRGKVVKQGTVQEITGAGQEVIFQVDGYVSAALLVQFEEKGWTAEFDKGAGRLRVAVERAEDLERVMSEGMQLLAGAGIPVTGVTRGRSLEESFLALTNN